MTLAHDEAAYARGNGGQWVTKQQSEATVSLGGSASAELMETSAAREANRSQLEDAGSPATTKPTTGSHCNCWARG